MALDDFFHKHLEVFKQCEQRPFNLCRIGAKLLVQAVNEIGVIQTPFGDKTLISSKGSPRIR